MLLVLCWVGLYCVLLGTVEVGPLSTSGVCCVGKKTITVASCCIGVSYRTESVNISSEIYVSNIEL